MSDLDTVRTYISDPQQYGVATSQGDGSVKEFLYPNAPIYTGTTKVYLNGVLVTSYAVDESIGLITMDTAPGSGTEVRISAKFTLLTDAQITGILTNYGSDFDGGDAVMLTAADCLDIIASSEAMIQKKIKMLDLETDGPSIARSLRDHAVMLRKQVLDPDFQGDVFDLAEEVYDATGFREKVIKDWMRNT